MKLVHKGTKKEVQIGDKVKSFRGTEATVRRIERPEHGGSSGRLYVEEQPGGSYPSVYGCEWIEREDQ